MPNLKHRKKSLLQSQKRNALNNWRKRQIKEAIRGFSKAVQSHDVQAAEAEYRRTCGLLDKFACTSTLHRNTAARRKSRLARRLNDLKSKHAAN